MNRNRKWLVSALVCLMTVLLLSGCRNTAVESSTEAERSADQYTIYYTNVERTALKEHSYTIQATSFEGMLEELLVQLQSPPDMAAEEETQSALPPEVKINEHTLIGVDNLCIDLNTGYLGLSRTSQMLLRAALVKTLVQLPGIYHVSITVEGQPVQEEDGTVIGPMDSNSFIISGGYGINFYHQAELKLLFPDAETKLLKQEKRNVNYSSNVILARVVSEELIKGPQESGLLAVADKKTDIKSVRIEKGICILDMDEDFNLISADQADPETCLYAFVNTICESTSVRGVQFQIDGKTNVRFRDSVNLDGVFDRAPDLEMETEENGGKNKS